DLVELSRVERADALPFHLRGNEASQTDLHVSRGECDTLWRGFDEDIGEDRERIPAFHHPLHEIQALHEVLSPDADLHGLPHLLAVVPVVSRSPRDSVVLALKDPVVVVDPVDRVENAASTLDL